MSKQEKEIFTNSKENEEEKKIQFRRLRRKLPTKKLWLLGVMAIALAYLFYLLQNRY